MWCRFCSMRARRWTRQITKSGRRCITPALVDTRVWCRCCSTLAAHSALITSVCFTPYGAGELLATAAHDGLVKLWRRRDWALHTTLAGHDGKVMCVDFAAQQPQQPQGGGGPRLVSAGFDRTFKVWAADDA